jgi:hypothetical protein
MFMFCSQCTKLHVEEFNSTTVSSYNNIIFDQVFFFQKLIILRLYKNYLISNKNSLHERNFPSLEGKFLAKDFIRTC